jgi:polar amino acid transport system substrate-binding protein
MKSILIKILIVFILLFANAAYSKELVCGIATGFPPYQFQADGKVAGFDADVIRLILDRLNEKFRFIRLMRT